MEPTHKPGDPITADLMNEIIRGQQRPAVRVIGSDSARQGSNGQLQIAIDKRRGPYIVKTTSAITAISGTTLGQGTAELYVRTPGTTNLVDTGIELDPVWNWGGAIATDIFQWIDFDENGDPYFVQGGAAGGTFIAYPTAIITTNSFATLTVYQTVGGTKTSVGSAKCYNYDGSSTVAGDGSSTFALNLIPDGGGDYTIVSQSCA